jgi:hypothetical protein
VDAVELELSTAGSSRGRGSSRLEGKAIFGLSNLSELEVPRDKLGQVKLVRVVLNLLKNVRSVGASNVDLERSQVDPRIIVGKEQGQDVKDGILGVNDFLDHVQARLTVIPAGLTIPRLDNRGAQDMLHLGSALLKGRKRTLNHNLTSLKRDLRGRS